jgi:hypothetical protein
MYYSLAYFLRHNEWIDPDSVPNLVRPADFDVGDNSTKFKFQWMPWFNASLTALAPYENCDCYREPKNNSTEEIKSNGTENRYYYDPTRNNTVVYFQALGTYRDIRGHWNYHPHEAAMTTASQRGAVVNDTRNGTAVGPLPTGRHPLTWSYDWPTAIRQQVKRVKPNVLVINAGKWPHDFDNPIFVESVVAAIHATGIPQPIWMTTPSERRLKFRLYRETDDAMCRHEFFQKHNNGCLNQSGWTSKLNKNYWIDRHHFREPVYRKMNEQLLTHLGIVSSQAGAAGSSSRMMNWTELGILADDDIM